MHLPPGCVFTKYDHEGGCRYEVHLAGQNIAYAFTKDVDKETVHIDGLYTSPEHREKSLATYLLSEIEKNNTGKLLQLKAEPYKEEGLSTQQLVAFYKKLGYKAVSDNDVMMLKKL